MIRRFSAFPLALVLLVSACDGSGPAAGEDALPDAEVEGLLVAALDAGEETSLPLPSLERLLRQTYRAIREDPERNSEGIDFLRRSRAQARLARAALEAGDEEGARAHKARSEALTLQAILSVLGEDVATEALAGVDQALSRLETRLAGKNIPDRYLQALARIQEMSARGHDALDGGNPRAALRIALRAADGLRAIVPRYQAEVAIRRADRALRAAYDLVVSDATEAERNALRKARALLAAGKEAFRDRDFRLAIILARESTALSLEVLEGRSGG
jgi:hypothetical protein